MRMDAVLPYEILDRFRAIILTHTGLVVPDHDLPHLSDVLARRVQVTVGEPPRYLALLTSEGTAGEQEWRELVLELTTGESYFFRDAGQMRLLQEVILPELVAARRGERTLRCWSAGCSTGEEPYSLAILLRGLLASAGPWNLLLKGTDINEYALQRARAGRYSRWAFRGVAEEVVERHFFRSHGEWLVDAAVREMVSFEKLNLIKDLFPEPQRGLYEMDLIVCRNVFIYFSHETIAGIMARFAACLRPGGFILTGHAEVQQPVSQLVTAGILPLVARQFPDSVIFQRPATGDPVPRVRRTMMGRERMDHPPVFQPQAGKRVAPVTPFVSPVLPRTPFGQTAGVAVPPSSPVVAPANPSVEKGLKEAETLFGQGRYGESIRLAEGLLSAHPLAGELCLLLARNHANLGEGTKAEGYCRDALRHRPFAAEPHFLLANLVQDRGDVEQAKELLKKTLYLDHAHVPAYLQLASLYQEEGVGERARQMRLGALDVLHGLPMGSRVAHYEEWTVKELVVQLEQLLGQEAGVVGRPI
ncbi:MAG: hypothetical protein H7837_10225 [Magnetococcus sp. MYC-9]